MFPVLEQIKNVSQTLSTNVYLLAHLKCHLNDRKGIKQFKSIKVNRRRDIRQGNRWISGEWFRKEMIDSAVVKANRRQTSDGLSNWQHSFLQNQGLEVNQKMDLAENLQNWHRRLGRWQPCHGLSASKSPHNQVDIKTKHLWTALRHRWWSFLKSQDIRGWRQAPNSKTTGWRIRKATGSLLELRTEFQNNH